MNCPLCLDTTLDITFHAGIELDICPRCRGVWLDRGELERLAQDGPTGRDDRGRDDRDRVRDDDTADDRPRKGDKKKRKKRLAERLGDVFEEIVDL